MAFDERPAAPAEIIDPLYYAEHGYPYEQWAKLRRESPVAWVEPRDTQPFWAITLHEDIVRISRSPKRFGNAPRFVVNPDYPPSEGEAPGLRTILNMDPPDHGAYRGLVSRRFTSRALRPMAPRIDAVVRELFDGLAAGGEFRECDLVEDLASLVPIYVTAELLGMAREDWPLLLRWANCINGAADPEINQGKSAAELSEQITGEIFDYFAKLTANRRVEPRDDISTALALGEFDGARLPQKELLSYFYILIAAGGETTRNAVSGGVLAFLEHPEELARLQADPGLLDPAVEEILRWSTPIIHFCRSAREDTELRGQTVRAGESVVLFYPSANRDEAVFDEPERFRIDREPNRHLALGVGEHFCLGAHLARLQLRAIFREWSTRIRDAELTGPLERLRLGVVGGIKHLPLRYRMQASGARAE